MSQQKRQRELRKAEKATAKREKRYASAPKGDSPPVESIEDTYDPAGFESAASRADQSASNDESVRTPAMVKQTISDQNATAYCKVCKAMTEHSMVESKGSNPGRARCNTCDDTHPFRAFAPAAGKQKTTKKKAATKKQAGIDASYDGLMRGRDLSVATKYDIKHRFEDQDLVDHQAFGVGMVTRVLADRKIEVRFREGDKLLVHER